MGKLLQKLLDVVLTGGLKKLLLGAGLSLVSITIVYTVLNYYLDKVLNQLQTLGAVGQIGQIGIALMGIAGVDTALSIVIGAYIVKFTIKKSQVFLSKGRA